MCSFWKSLQSINYRYCIQSEFGRFFSAIFHWQAVYRKFLNIFSNDLDHSSKFKQKTKKTKVVNCKFCSRESPNQCPQKNQHRFCKNRLISIISIIMQLLLNTKLKFPYFYKHLFHSLFKVKFNIDHFVLGGHRER